MDDIPKDKRGERGGIEKRKREEKGKDAEAENLETPAPVPAPSSSVGVFTTTPLPRNSMEPRRFPFEAEGGVPLSFNYWVAKQNFGLVLTGDVRELVLAVLAHAGNTSSETPLVLPPWLRSRGISARRVVVACVAGLNLPAVEWQLTSQPTACPFLRGCTSVPTRHSRTAGPFDRGRHFDALPATALMLWRDTPPLPAAAVAAKPVAELFAHHALTFLGKKEGNWNDELVFQAEPTFGEGSDAADIAAQAAVEDGLRLGLMLGPAVCGGSCYRSWTNSRAPWSLHRIIADGGGGGSGGGGGGGAEEGAVGNGGGGDSGGSGSRGGTNGGNGHAMENDGGGGSGGGMKAEPAAADGGWALRLAWQRNGTDILRLRSPGAAAPSAPPAGDDGAAAQTSAVVFLGVMPDEGVAGAADAAERATAAAAAAMAGMSSGPPLVLTLLRAVPYAAAKHRHAATAPTRVVLADAAGADTTGTDAAGAGSGAAAGAAAVAPPGAAPPQAAPDVSVAQPDGKSSANDVDASSTSAGTAAMAAATAGLEAANGASGVPACGTTFTPPSPAELKENRDSVVEVVLGKLRPQEFALTKKERKQRGMPGRKEMDCAGYKETPPPLPRQTGSVTLSDLHGGGFGGDNSGGGGCEGGDGGADGANGDGDGGRGTSTAVLPPAVAAAAPTSKDSDDDLEEGEIAFDDIKMDGTTKAVMKERRLPSASQLLAASCDFGAVLLGLDCEMVYTEAGLELAHAVLVNAAGQTVYDELVKPSRPVTNYNSCFSGIFEETLRGVTTTLADVQRDLASFLHRDVFLVGHSIEGDLHALQLVHRRVIDTAALYPSAKGYPFKMGLRNLCKSFLMQNVQGGHGATGHDPREDARNAVELALLKMQAGPDFGLPGPWASNPTPPRETVFAALGRAAAEAEASIASGSEAAAAAAAATTGFPTEFPQLRCAVVGDLEAAVSSEFPPWAQLWTRHDKGYRRESDAVFTAGVYRQEEQQDAVEAGAVTVAAFPSSSASEMLETAVGILRRGSGHVGGGAGGLGSVGNGGANHDAAVAGAAASAAAAAVADNGVVAPPAEAAVTATVAPPAAAAAANAAPARPTADSMEEGHNEPPDFLWVDLPCADGTVFVSDENGAGNPDDEESGSDDERADSGGDHGDGHDDGHGGGSGFSEHRGGGEGEGTGTNGGSKKRLRLDDGSHGVAGDVGGGSSNAGVGVGAAAFRKVRCWGSLAEIDGAAAALYAAMPRGTLLVVLCQSSMTDMRRLAEAKQSARWSTREEEAKSGVAGRPAGRRWQEWETEQLVQAANNVLQGVTFLAEKK